MILGDGIDIRRFWTCYTNNRNNCVGGQKRKRKYGSVDSVWSNHISIHNFVRDIYDLLSELSRLFYDSISEHNNVSWFYSKLHFRNPLPWLISCIVANSDITANSKGSGCSLALLILMIIGSMVTLLAFRWKLRKLHGLVLIILYILFVCVSLAFIYDVVQCPV